ncbi:PhnD/SsuA/transferrin family substrate-binding protein [Sulfurimonas sp. MAG313]|nr:PhnD/SsuA/transferrin family substrate-binding protein [Sulfurimonas sp. MAG313]
MITLFSNPLFAQNKSINIAFFPYTSPSKILLHQKALKHFLQKELQVSISIITAKNIKEYINNVDNGVYDIIFTAPHIGRRSELSSSYSRLVMTKNKIQGYYIVKKESPYTELADIKNKTISMASPLTILHQIALMDLKELGIKEGENLTINITKNHMNSIFSLLKGSSDVALTGIKLWKVLKPKYKQNLKFLAGSTKIPGFLVMYNKTIDKEFSKELQKTFLRFEKSSEAKKYIFKGFKPITNDAMKLLDNYTNILK